MTSAELALEHVEDGQILGLGTGRAASAFIKALGERIHVKGMNIRGVASSEETADLAKSVGISLVSLDDIDAIDVAFDGSDEVDPQLNLIKGRGGALVREKIVATAAKKFVVLVGPEKLVEKLGGNGLLPVEIVPFALEFCRRKLDAMGHKPTARKKDGELYITDNGNPILDCHIAETSDPVALEKAILALPGVVDTGLFLGMTDIVIVDDGDSARVLQRAPR